MPLGLGQRHEIFKKVSDCHDSAVFRMANLLDKAIATASVGIVLLKLDKLELSERFENSLQILFGDIKMNVSDVQTMERNMVGVRATRFGVAGLAVLFSFGELNNYGNT